VQYPQATITGRDELDIADSQQVAAIDWSKYDVILNAAAYVNADDSQTSEGRIRTWKSNAIGPRNLAEVARKHNLHLVHISSEYVFDGSQANHSEDEPFSPISVYGQTKAAADTAVTLVANHHILRTSWVIGDGHNFVKTMKRLADMRINPKVVGDQYGRLTFASEIVRAIDYILTHDVPVGTYNVSNSGKIMSWADIAAETFELAGYDRERVRYISTDEYKADKPLFAPRPTHSDMDLSKLQRTGFVSQDYQPLLATYVQSLEGDA
jgi:dTDP-4-dehydrorhamnose 3,5-epimerase/reductase